MEIFKNKAFKYSSGRFLYPFTKSWNSYHFIFLKPEKLPVRLSCTGSTVACKEALWGALAAGQKRNRACTCQECLKPDCKLSLFFGSPTECTWKFARRVGVPLPQEQSSAVFFRYRSLSLMSINFKRKNKNWTKDQWNWRGIHGWTV